MNLKAHCKINLALRVYEKMPNGYHRIETVMIKVGLADEIRIKISEGNSITSCVPNIQNDISVKAASLYLQAAKVRKQIDIEIDKKIPVGGGLGGGSADAAAVLRLLQTEFMALSDTQLYEIAAQLGADVPFLLSPAALGFAQGVGDKLRRWPNLPARPLILIHPGFPVSTPEAYQMLGRALTYNHPNGTSFAPHREPNSWSDVEELLKIGNDLQEVVERRYPAVREIRKSLNEVGSSFAQMSGSGSTVFGLFDSNQDAEKAVLKLNSKWKPILTHTLSTDKNGWGVDKR